MHGSRVHEPLRRVGSESPLPFFQIEHDIVACVTVISSMADFKLL